MRTGSLFWKIFLAFWLANVLIIAATSYLVFHAYYNSDRYAQKQEAILHSAEQIIERFEATPGAILSGRESDRRHPPRRGALKIINEYNDVVFTNLPADAPAPTMTEPISYTSHSGQHYRIYFHDHKAAPFFMQARRGLVVRLLLVCLVSGLVSYGLTLLITRPLKQLGAQIQPFSRGELDARLSDQLLARRDEIGDLSREFDLMINNIGTLITSQQHLLHDISHELRAPLARLMAAIGLLQQQYANDDPMLQRVEQESEQINVLIEQILRLARFENTETLPTDINPGELLDSCLNNTCFEFPDHNLHWADRPTLPVNLHTDATMLAMAVQNLLRNACQHTPPGSEITVSLARRAHSIVIMITDNGPGVRPGELEQLFKPFYRNGENSGFGLGLNIAKRAVEKNGGDIRVANRDSGGLVFTLEFPING